MNEIEVCVAESGVSGGVSKVCLEGAEGRTRLDHEPDLM